MNLRSCTGVIPNCIPNLPVSIFFTIFDIPLHVKARLDTFPAGSITSDGTEDMAVEFDTMCGGFLFLGIFLGLPFLLATVLIIYYKQISEGMEDKNRFAIMQQVGLSQKEVKHSIHTQILTVFFLPLITAGIHVMFAYPIIRAILRAMMLSSETVFITCTVASFLVFSVLYAVVYALTAKVYYRIISEDNK